MKKLPDNGKKQEIVSHTQGKQESVETAFEMAQVLELGEKDIK